MSGAVLGGEKSGHVIVREHSTSGDGIVTALEVLRVIGRRGRPLAELAAEIPLLPQQQRAVPARHRDQWEGDPVLQRALAQATARLGAGGRILVRPSGTEPALRVMVEGPDADAGRRAGRRDRDPRRGASKLARPGAAPGSFRRLGRHVRDRRLHRTARGGPHPHRGAQAPRVPRLRLGRDRPGRRPAASCSSRSEPASWPTSRPRIADRTPHAAIGLAHTRWATHGRPNDLNAHPHQDCTGDITVIHNGIIENFRELRDGLEARGHTLTSETDTEAIAHLIEEAYAGDLADAVRARPPPGPRGLRARRHAPRRARPARRRPDERAARRRRRRRRELPRQRRRRDPRPHRPGHLPRGGRRRRPAAGGVTITDLDGAPIERRISTIDWTPEAAEKGGYEHFMLKEMHEQPTALLQAITGRVTTDDRIEVAELADLGDVLRTVDRVELVACGTAYYASLVGAAAIQDWAGHPGPGDRRLRVPLQPAAARRADARHRGHPVGRDGRHDRADPARPRARLPDRRRDQHGRLGDHPRGGRGPLPPGRPGDRGRRLARRS